MRKYEVVAVVRVLGDKFNVAYRLDGKETRWARVDATFGLEKAVAEMGKALASLPPMERPPVGIKKRRFPFRARSTSDQAEEI